MRRVEAASLVEVLLAILIVGTCAVTLYGSIAHGARVAERSEMAYLASQLAREMIDEARTLELDDPAVRAALSGPVELGGHALDTLHRLGVARRAPSLMLPGDSFRYPVIYHRFHVMRRVTPVAGSGPAVAVRQFEVVVDIAWEEEGAATQRRGPAGSIHRAVVTVGVE
ncbi:MAG: hypothetical protein HY815_25890 [Candidatus Riflebacteria bacterium]|nr:hypothetical protein [Candidatus Riflebacteria bacterium]